MSVTIRLLWDYGILLTYIDTITMGPVTVKVPWCAAVGALYDIRPLTLWADWYLWPSHEPVPSDARLLRGQGIQGILDLSQSLDRIGRGRPRTHPDKDALALAMLLLAAKFAARGVHDKAVAMAAMLGACSGQSMGSSPTS